ncbi:MAG: YicC family protein [Spirochaetales bacterium]|nr:YicC family protein [Spirochaetales bacterium]
MKSMTGFGYTEYNDEKMNLTLELKSYNNRYLDVYVNIPPFLSPLEPGIRAFLNRKVGRGKVECVVRLKELEEDMLVTIDKGVAAGYIQALKSLKESTGIDGEIELSHLLQMNGILKTSKNRDLDRYEKIINQKLEEAFQEFEESKIQEGTITEADLVSSLDILEDRAAHFESRACEMEEEIKKNIRERFEKLLEERYDENRVLAETAILLMKYSINEEIVRLKGHLSSFREGMKEDKPIGKKLDFLCQEIGREINTIGSKSSQNDVIQAVVDSKDNLERIREQLRNLE